MKNKTTLILIILTVVVIAGTAVLYNAFGDKVALDLQQSSGDIQAVSDAEYDTQKKADDFTVYAADGEAVRLSDFAGKPVIVNFWASWCNPCKSEMPAIQEMWEKYGDKVEFLIVNLVDNASETVASAQKFLATTDYTFPVYFDTQQDAAYTYSVYSIPTTLFVDAEGNLVQRFSGAMSHTALETFITEIL